MAKHRKEPGIWLAIVLALGIVGSALLIWFVFTYVPATDADPLTGSSTSSVDPPPEYPTATVGPERTIQSPTGSPEPRLPDRTKGKVPPTSVRPPMDDSEPPASSGY